MINAAHAYQHLPLAHKRSLSKNMAVGRGSLKNQLSIKMLEMPSFLREKHRVDAAADSNKSASFPILRKVSTNGEWWLLGAKPPEGLCPKATNESCVEVTSDAVETLDGQSYTFECTFRYFHHEPREHVLGRCPLNQLCSEPINFTAKKIMFALVHWLASVRITNLEVERERQRSILAALMDLICCDSNIKVFAYAIKFRSV